MTPVSDKVRAAAQGDKTLVLSENEMSQAYRLLEAHGEGTQRISQLLGVQTATVSRWRQGLPVTGRTQAQVNSMRREEEQRIARLRKLGEEDGPALPSEKVGSPKPAPKPAPMMTPVPPPAPESIRPGQITAAPKRAQGSVDELLDRAAAMDGSRVQAALGAVRTTLQVLVDVVSEEGEQQRLRDEIAKKRQELAELEAQLTTSSEEPAVPEPAATVHESNDGRVAKVSKASRTSPIREWAVAQGIEAPGKLGRLSREVLDAYYDAHPDEVVV